MIYFLFFSPSVWTHLIFKAHNYSNFILNDLKWYRSTTFSCTNHLWTLIAIEQHTRNFWCSRNGFAMFCGLSFWVLDPSTLGGSLTFSFPINFWWFWVHQKHQEEGFKFCLDTKNNKALPLDPACPECLSVCSLAVLSYLPMVVKTIQSKKLRKYFSR